MPTFAYKAIDKRGGEMTGMVDAENLALAINQVRSMGYFPTKVTETTASSRSSQGKRKREGFYIGGVRQKQLTLFVRQLATLIDAGLPLLRSLHVLRAQMKPSKLRDVLRDISDDVQSGSTLSEALQKHPRVFDTLFVNMVRAGEIGGMLEVVLNRIAEFMEKRQALKRRVKGAMVYPIAVLLIAGGVVYFILTSIVPKFAEVFAGMGAKMPPLTNMLIEASNWLAAKWWMLLLIIVGTIIGVKLLFKIQHVKSGWDHVVLKIPLFGSLVQKIAVARFARTLGTMVASGVPILQSLKITRDVVGNIVVAQAIQRVHDSVREGETIAAPLEESKIFPQMVTSMIDVGEETGSLDQMLMKVADVYDSEVEVAIAAMLQLMEPALIVGLGFIVGFIVIALYMPLFSLADQLSSG